MNLYSNTRLIRQLNKGSTAAFETIFDRHWEDVYTICYKAINDREEAREMTQDIFKSIWERHDTIKITSSLSHYLTRAAKYQVYNFYRNRQLHKEHMDCFFMDFCGAENCTENEVLHNQLQDQVGLLIDELPCQCKKVFQLSQHHHLSYGQIAEKLNISIKTVEYHIHNARKYLRSELQSFR